MHYSEDVSAMKLLVAAIWRVRPPWDTRQICSRKVRTLDTLHVVFMSHLLYYYLITNYGVTTSLEYMVWSLPASVLINSLVVSLVHLFFIHKIYHLCRSQVKWLVTAPIILLVLVQFGFGMETVVFEYCNPSNHVYRSADLHV
ncbi:hypothetical protein BKA82DRAFT_996487 [Pisolithus tinctorius]|uniref:Uncharacterized protein n=1 Tax=Pisolithus tinctorius Marx 270 TaxID=870435 RepID=A0A0C3JKJ0_PISTI|nr:hypothetical protein BKA82DRAFT_996487 [Pisolithus tinctorius]KIO09653.1 hypothetical protein M404DRAFT_996487 [Pisolithus tinctorius Marx 270]